MAEAIVSAPEPLLVRCFAEFDVLPDLLVRRLRHPNETEAETVDAWEQTLDELGCDIDHVEDDDIPGAMSLTAFMARDTLSFCRRIGLVDARGALSAPGLFIARMGEMPYRQRPEEDSREMTRMLADGIHRGFLGADDLPLAGLLQRASAELASQHGLWPSELGGLLLSEVDALLRCGVVDSAKAEDLARSELAMMRVREFDALSSLDDSLAGDADFLALQAPLPSPDDQPIEEQFTARLEAAYANDPRWAPGAPLTTTGLRATAMALVFAELLALGGLLMGPQVLCPWEAPEDAG